jgi:hypothetical protein
MKEVIFYLLIIGAGTGGELCVSRAMKVVGEVKDFRPTALLGVASRALRVSWMWLGLSLMGTAFFALLAVLSIENVSLVVPVTALSYAGGALGGRFFLGEQVTRRTNRVSEKTESQPHQQVRSDLLIVRGQKVRIVFQPKPLAIPWFCGVMPARIWDSCKPNSRKRRGARTCVESSVSPTNIGHLIPIAFETPLLP